MFLFTGYPLQECVDHLGEQLYSLSTYSPCMYRCLIDLAVYFIPLKCVLAYISIVFVHF